MGALAVAGRSPVHQPVASAGHFDRGRIANLHVGGLPAAAVHGAHVLVNRRDCQLLSAAAQVERGPPQELLLGRQRHARAQFALPRTARLIAMTSLDRIDRIRQCLRQRVCVDVTRQRRSALRAGLVPVGVERSGAVDALVGVRAEVVALGLDQVGGEAHAAQAVVVAERAARRQAAARPPRPRATTRRHAPWRSPSSSQNLGSSSRLGSSGPGGRPPGCGPGTARG